MSSKAGVLEVDSIRGQRLARLGNHNTVDTGHLSTSAPLNRIRMGAWVSVRPRFLQHFRVQDQNPRGSCSASGSAPRRSTMTSVTVLRKQDCQTVK